VRFWETKNESDDGLWYGVRISCESFVAMSEEKFDAYLETFCNCSYPNQQKLEDCPVHKKFMNAK
jgi:hypothetical protein